MTDNSTNKAKGPIRRFFSALMNFLDGFRRVVINLFFLLILLMFVLTLSRSVKPVVVPEGGALVIAPQGQLVEKYEATPGEIALAQLLGEPPLQTRQRDLLSGIRGAVKDKRIGALVLDLDGLTGAAPAQIEELQRAIKAFRETDRPVFAWATHYGQAQYQIAAVADHVWIDPLGGVLVEGYAAWRSYYRDLLGKLDVQVNVFRVGKFKSAVEPLLRDDMSDEAREANRLWLSDLWEVARSAIAAGRNTDASTIDAYVNEIGQKMQAAGGDSAKVALEAGLIDQIGPRADFNAAVIAVVGEPEWPEGETEEPSVDPDYKQISLDAYRLALGRERIAKEADLVDQKTVSIVVAQGMMIDGTGEADVIDSRDINELLAELRHDDDVAAVVLRIDSPGGSIFTAENIRREVLRLKAAGKPVVISMGAVAASGGYWISADADRIFAEASTITGSIGVFGVVPTWQQTLEKAGVHSDGLGTSEIAGWNPMRELPKPMAVAIQSGVEHGYDQFLNVVAKGRNLERASVAEIAEGRVWSGQQAKNLGLVDELGGLREAAKAAAELAELGEDFRSEFATTPAGQMEQFLVDLAQRRQGMLSAFRGTDLFASNRLLRKIERSPLAREWLALAESMPWYRNNRAAAGQAYAWCACDLR